MARTRTREVKVVVPVEVLDRARRRVGRRATTSEAVRRALYDLAGVDPEQYLVKIGRPRVHPPREPLSPEALAEARRQAGRRGAAARWGNNRAQWPDRRRLVPVKCPSCGHTFSTMAERPKCPSCGSRRRFARYLIPGTEAACA